MTTQKKQQELTADERADILLKIENELDSEEGNVVPDFDMDFDFDFGEDVGKVNANGIEIVEDKELEKGNFIEVVKCPMIDTHRVMFRHAIELARHIKPKPEGYRYDCIVGGAFIFGDFLEALMRIHSLRCDTLTITTLSMSQDNADSLKLLADRGYFERLNLLVSVYFYSHERWGLIKYLKEVLGDKLTLAIASIHTKTIQFVEKKSGQKIIIHGSANLRSSANIEQFTIETNEQLYDFYDGIYRRLFDYYAIHKRANRYNQAFDIIDKL